MHYFPGENWYAIRVKYKHEAVTQKSLKRKGFSPLCLTYCEKSKRKDREKTLIKPFFPGYMFIKSELSPEVHVQVLKTPGVAQMLQNRLGPLPIPENQIQNMLRLEEYSGKLLPQLKFSTGMLVRVVKGALAGLICRIDKIRRNFVSVGIDSIPGSVFLNIDPDLLEPVESQSMALV